MQLKHLTKLHLGNAFGRQTNSRQINDVNQGFTFYEGVAPVLSTVGSNLKKLVLEDFNQVDIHLIGHLCPTLEHLAVSGATSFAPVLSSKQNVTPSGTTKEGGLQFRCLQVFELWQDFSNSICEPMLKLILCNGSPIRRMVFQRFE